MSSNSNNSKYLIITISLVILIIITWTLYKHFSSENYNKIIEKYNDIMNKLLDDKNLDFEKILLYQSNYIDDNHKYKKEYEIAKTIYNEKLANLSSILLEISNQNLTLREKNLVLENSLKELNSLISTGTDTDEVLKFINTDFILKYKDLKMELENRKDYYSSIQTKINGIKDFISSFNDIIKNYNDSLNYGKEFKNKISDSDIIKTLNELDEFKLYIESNVQDSKVKETFFSEIEKLKSKVNNVKSLIEKESDDAIRQLSSEYELDTYEKNIEKFNELSENNSKIIEEISLFLTRFNSKLETIKNTNELFNDIKDLDQNIKDLKSLLESLKTI